MKHSSKTNYKKGIINDLSITPSEDILSEKTDEYIILQHYKQTFK